MVKEMNMFNLTVKFIIKILRKLQRLFKLGKNSNCHYAYNKKPKDSNQEELSLYYKYLNSAH